MDGAESPRHVNAQMGSKKLFKGMDCASNLPSAEYIHMNNEYPSSFGRSELSTWIKTLWFGCVPLQNRKNGPPYTSLRFSKQTGLNSKICSSAVSSSLCCVQKPVRTTSATRCSASNRLLYLIFLYLFFSTFSLSYQAVTGVTGKPCSHCPTACYCYEDSLGCAVNCSGGYLINVPDITTLDPTTTQLYLHKSCLTDLRESALTALPALRNVTLSGNSWVCNCELQWLQDLINNVSDLASNITVTDADNVLCSYPDVLRGQKISEADFSTVICASSYVSCLSGVTGVNDSVIIWEYAEQNKSIGGDRNQCKLHCYNIGYKFALRKIEDSICFCSNQKYEREGNACNGSCSPNSSGTTVCDRQVLGDTVWLAVIDTRLDGFRPYSQFEAVELTAVALYGNVESHLWMFGDSDDGIFQKEADVAHKYALAGTYSTSVTVISGTKSSSTNSILLTVEDPIGGVVLHCNEVVQVNNRLTATIDIGRGTRPRLKWMSTSEDGTVAHDTTFMPTGAKFYEQGTTAYNIEEDDLDWLSAYKECLAKNGDLAIVDNALKTRFLLDNLIGAVDTRIFWIGVRGSNSADVFFHVNNHSISHSMYTNWGSGQPQTDSNPYDQCVAFNASSLGQWQVESCKLNLPYICQYRSADFVEEPQHFLAGTAIFGFASATVVTNVTEQTLTSTTGSKKVYVLLLPGLWIQHSGKAYSWEFVSAASPNPDPIRLLLFRPKCSSISGVRPGCPSIGNPHLTCNATACHKKILECPHNQQFCHVTGACQSLSEPCNLSGSVQDIPSELSYTLVSEKQINANTGSVLYQLIMEEAISVSMDDVLAVEFTKSGDITTMDHTDLPLLCQESERSSWRQHALLVQLHSWQAIGGAIPLTNKKWMSPLWCDIRLHYTEPSTGDVPQSAFLTPTEPGNYTFTVTAFNNVSESSPASCQVQVQNPIKSLSLLGPVPQDTTLEGVPVIYVAKGLPSEVALFVEGGGNDTVSEWLGVPGGTIVRSLQSSCPETFRSTIPECSVRSGQRLNVVSSNITFNDSGYFNVTASNSYSSASITVRVLTADPITGLTILPVGTSRILANIPQIFTGQVDTGTDVSYSWVIDNLTKFKYENQEYNVLFRTPADYQLSLTAENVLGSVTETITLTVDTMNKLKDLEFIGLPTVAQRNLLLELEAKVKVDINIYYQVRWTIDDVSTTGPVVDQPHAGVRPVPSEEQVWVYEATNHSFISTGEKTIEVQFFNDYDSITHSDQVDIRDPMEYVIVEMVSLVPATGDALEFFISASPSTYGVTFNYNWGDGTPDTSTEDNPKTHIFSDPDTYTITLTADNGINQIVNTTNITVYERITGLLLMSNDPTELGYITQITASVETGEKSAKFSFNFNDASISPIVNSSTPSASGSYSTPGRFNVTVSAANLISSDQEYIEVHVFEMVIENANTTQDCYKTNSNAVLQVFMQTDEVSLFDYSWSFEDGSSLSDTDNIFEHTFTEAKIHTVNARVTSKLSGDFSETPLLVCVQDEIAGLIMDPIIPVEIGSVTTIAISLGAGTNASIVIDFGDGSSPENITLPSIGVMHRYLNTGDFTVTVTATNLVSQLSTTAVAAVQEQVLGINISTSSAYGYLIARGESVIYTAITENGTDQNYDWDFGDGNTANRNDATHVYATTGTFTVTVTVSNSISTDTHSVQVIVKEPVNGASISTPSSVVRANDTVNFQATVTSGGPGEKYYWKVEPGFNLTLGTNSFSFSFPSIFNYTVTVKVENEVSADYATIYILSADIILGVTISTQSLVDDLYAERNKSTHFEALLDNGEKISSTTAGSTDSLTYVWKILLNGVEESQYQGSAEINHTFQQVSVYTVSVNVSNGVSTQVADLAVRSVDPIGTINFRMVEGVDGAAPSGELVTLEAQVTQGTDVTFYWDPDETGADIMIDANLTHTYDLAGTYFPFVTASNVLGNKTDSYELLIQDRVTGVKITQEDSYVDFYVAHRETTDFKASVVTGSDVSYSWFYVDTNNRLSDIENSTNQFMKWSFPEVETYTLIVNGSNLISWDQVNYTVIVLKPIRMLNLVADSFLIATGSTVEFNASVAQGDETNFNFFIDDVLQSGSVIDKHKAQITNAFTTPGTYIVRVEARNNVSAVNESNVVTVRDPIVNPQIGGCCVDGQYAAVGDNLTFFATVDAGTNITFEWNITYENGTSIIAIGAQVSEVLTETGQTAIALSLENGLQERCIVRLSLEGEVPGQPSYINENVTLIINTIGTNVTHEINFGDTSPIITTQEAEVVHIYTQRGSYNIIVTSSNKVSTVTNDITATIHQLECEAPSITFVESSKASKFFRSRTIYVESKVTINCTAYEVDYAWKVYQQDDCANLDATNIKTGLTSNRPLLVLPALTLEVSNYCFKVTVSYHDTPLSHSAVVPVGVLSTPLTVVISGGTTRFLYYAADLHLDAGKSFDPDLPLEEQRGISFLWSCQESIATDETLYGYSPSNRTTSCSIPVSGLTQPSFSIPGNSTLKQGYEYDYTVQASKTGKKTTTTTQKVVVVSRDIPTVTISCYSCNILSSYEISASFHLGLEGACTNCANLESISWEVNKIVGANLTTTFPLDLTTTTTGSSSKYIVVKQGALENSFAYEFKLRIVANGKEGYSKLVLYPNSPPGNGTCQMQYSDATVQVLETSVMFKCSNWSDGAEENPTPLVYTIIASRVSSTDDTSDTFILYRGTQDSYEAYLPLGLDEQSNMVNIRITVEDQLGIVTIGLNENVAVVQGDTIVSTTMWLRNKVSDELEKLLMMNDPQDIVDFSVAAITVLNSVSDKANYDVHDSEYSDRVFIRERITSIVADIEGTTLKDLQQNAAVLKQCVQVPSEMQNSDIQRSISRRIDSMTVQMTEFVDHAGQSTFQKATNDVLDIVGGMIRMVNFAVYDSSTANDIAAITVNGSINYTEAYRHEQITTLVSNIDSLVATVLNSKVVGEEAVTFRSPVISIAALRTTPSQLPLALANGGCYYLFPVELFHFLDPNEEIFAVSKTYDQNPFTYNYPPSQLTNNGFANITSRVPSIEFTFANGTPITLDNIADASDQNDKRVKLAMIESSWNTLSNEETLQIATFAPSYYQPQSGLEFVTTALEPLKSMAVTLTNRNRNTNTAVHIMITYDKRYDNGKTEPTPKLVAYFDYQPKPNDVNHTMMMTITDSEMESDANHQLYTFYLEPANSTTASNFYLNVSNYFNYQLLDVNIAVYYSACHYYDEEVNSWQSNGVYPSAESTFKVSVCFSDHLTSFGSFVINPPNIITVTDIVNLDFSQSTVALITVIVIMILYVIAMIWARKLDLRDIKRASLIPLCGRNGLHKYEITIKTAAGIGSGTTANVGICLYGYDQRSGSRHLSRKGAFQRGSVDTMQIAHDVSLGEIFKIKLWHDNTGVDPGWCVDRAMVKDLQTGVKYYFLVNSWLQVYPDDEDETCLEKYIRVATEEELTNFSQIFGSQLSYGWEDAHMWLSVIERPARSRFTRVQRVTCCVTLLLTFMVFSAFWYQGYDAQGEIEVEDTLVGIVRWKDIAVGAIVSLMAFPISLIIVCAFKKTKSHVAPVKPWPDRAHTAQTIEILDEMIGAGNRRFVRSVDDISEFGDACEDDNMSRHTRNQLPGQNEFLEQYLQEEAESGTLFRARSQTPVSNKTKYSIHAGTSVTRAKLHKTSGKIKSCDIKDTQAWSSDDSAVQLSSGPPSSSSGATGSSDDLFISSEEGQRTKSPEWPNRTNATKQGLLHYQRENDLQPPVKFETTTLTEHVEPKKPRLRRRNTAFVRAESSSPPNFIPDDPSDDDDELLNLYIEDDIVVTNKQANLRRTRVSKFEEDDMITIDEVHPGLGTDLSATSMDSDEESDESDVPLPDLPMSVTHSRTLDSRASTLLGTSPQLTTERYLLPHWCLYLNYVICFLTMGICIFFIIVYGNKFGPDTTKRWLLSMFVALLESIFLIEPIKVILFAAFLALITKPLNPDEDDNLVDQPLVETYEQVDMFSKVRAPGGFALDKCKKEASKTKRSNKLVLNLAIYLVFLSCVAAVASWDRDTLSYYNTMAVKESLFDTNFTLPSGTDGPYWYNGSSSFYHVRTVSDIWTWLDQVFAVKIFEDKSTLDNENLNNILLGSVRLRQQRSTLGTCLLDEFNKDHNQLTYPGQNCLSNTASEKQTSSFSPGWNLSGSNTWINTPAQFIGVKYWGQALMYDDSGYAQFLDSNSTTVSAQLDLQQLADQNWIDRYTRVVFVEFTLYNPATLWNMVTVAMFEMGVTGAVQPSYSIQTVHMFRPSSAFYLDMLFMPFIAIIGILLLVSEFKKIKNPNITPHRYFTKWTNWINLLVIALIIMLCILFLYKEIYMEEVFQAYLQDPTAFTNFYKIAFYTDLVTYTACILLTVIIIRAARILRFIKSWSVFGNTLAESAQYLLGASIMLLILIFNFAMLGYLIYGQSYTQVVEDFRDYPNAIYAMFRAFRGQLDVLVCFDYSPFFTILFFFSYYFGIFFIFCRLFAAIIINAYKFEHAKKRHLRQDVPDYEILKHLILRIKLRLGIIKPKKFRPVVHFEGMSTPSSRGSFASLDSFDTYFMPGRISQCSYATGISSASSDSGIGTPSDHSLSVFDYLTLEKPSDRPLDSLHLNYLYDRLETYSFDMLLWHFERVNQLGDEVLTLENDLLKITKRVEQRKKMKSQSKEIAVAASSMTARPNYISPESDDTLASRGQISLQSQQTLSSQASLNSGRRSVLSADSRFQTVLQSMFPLDQKDIGMPNVSSLEVTTPRNPPFRSRSYTGPSQSQENQSKTNSRAQISSASSVLQSEGMKDISGMKSKVHSKQRPHSDEGVRFNTTPNIISQAPHSHRSMNDINDQKQSSNPVRSKPDTKSKHKPLALYSKKSAW